MKNGQSQSEPPHPSTTTVIEEDPNEGNRVNIKFFKQALQQDWFWGMLQFVLLLVSLISVIYQLNLQRNTHLISTLEILDDRWASDQMLQARNSFCKNLMQDSTSLSPSGESIAEFFEQIGIYVKLNAIPEDFIWETYSWYIEHYYLLLEPGLVTIRQNDSTLYSQFVILNKSSRERSIRKGAPAIISDEDLTGFCEREIEITNFSLDPRS